MRVSKYIAMVLISFIVLFQDATSQTIGTVVSEVQIRVGRPLITMGPAGNILDNPFSIIALQSGGFRDFTANSTTYRLEGSDPWSNGGPLTAVASAVAGTYASCGLWLNDEQRASGTMYYGYTHAENNCNYSIGQTNKSMALMTSSNEGQTWSLNGQIITGTDTPTAGETTGEGDCTAVADTT